MFVEIAMTPTVNHVLVILYRAGGKKVDEHRLGWEEKHYPAINEAMRLGFMTRISSSRTSTFSLTRQGYREIGQVPPPITPNEILAVAFRLLFFGRPS